MKLILFIILILTPIYFINAENLTLDYQRNVSVDEEFLVNIELVNFSNDIYDIKFEILNGSRNIAQWNWDNIWKSTRYWINDVFKNETKQKIKLKIVNDYQGENEFNIKIKDSSDKIWIFQDYLIYIDSNKNFREEGQDISSEEKVELEWDEDEIINGNEFDIKISFINDKKEKDIKLWIENKGRIISDRYDEKNDLWKSGGYYINNFLDNDYDKVKLRIKEDFKDFNGEANLFFRTRSGFEYEKGINVLIKDNYENDSEEKIEKNESFIIGNENNDSIFKEPIKSIRLEFSNKTNLINKENVLYESKLVSIKKYSIFFFGFLCLALCILIAWKKLN